MVKTPLRELSFINSRIICLVLFSLSLFTSVFECRAEFVVINPGVERDSISQNTLRAIFGMRFRTWSDGTPITVFVLSDDNPVHRQFCKKNLEIFPYQLRWRWDRLVFSGMGQAPIEILTEEEMLERVASTPGSIGYLKGPFIDESVKTLQPESMFLPKMDSPYQFNSADSLLTDCTGIGP